MTLDTTIDSDVFLADFGVTALYNGTTSITVIFDNAYEAVEMNGVIMEARGPQAQCKTTDVPNAAHGDTLLINTVTYTVHEVQPDGTGFTTLMLKG